jgi:SAM-dependent methyltransferase
MAAAAKSKPAAAAGAAPPLKLRFRAWWDGVDTAELMAKRPPPAAAPPAKKSTVSAKSPDLPWNTPRVKMLQMLWGPGFSQPGGAAFSLWLANPCTINPTQTVIELGAGLGGTTRAIGTELGCWINGYEQDPELVAAGMALSTLAGLGKKAPIERYNPEALDLKPAAYDCILSRESIFAIRNRKEFFDQIARALKVGGQLAYVDIVQIPREGEPSPTYRDWVKGERSGCAPWSLVEHRKACADRALDLRVADDITGGVRGQVLQAMTDLLQKAEELKAADPAGKAALDALIGRWTRRITAIDAGDIGICRIHAIKIATKTMSNW